MKFAARSAAFEVPSVSAGPCVTLCLLAAMLAGCGAESKSATATQVLAKVNGDEITVHQLNDRLSQIQLPPNVDPAAARKQVLEALIDEQLLVQKAMADKLDRDPQVLQAIERNKRQILAQAAIEHLPAKTDIPPDETAKFYAANPDLFEKRRIYTFHQFLLETPKLEPSVKAKLDDVKTPADIVAILKSAGIKYLDQTAVRPAEMLPMGALPQVAKMSRGDVLVEGEGGQIMLLQLVDVTAEPVDLARATPTIQAYLATNSKKESALGLVKDMRQKGKIDYVGGVVNAAPAPAAEVPPPAKDDAAKSDDFIQKGISGLKK